MSKLALSSKFFLTVLKSAKFGSIQVTLPDDSIEIYGCGEHVARVAVKDYSALELILQKGDLGLAEAVIEDLIEVDDMAALVQWACENDHALGQALHGTWTGTLLYQIKNFLNRNSRAGAKKNIMAHYDLGNDFYRIWLDSTMSYSSGLYHHKEESLQQAQLNKYDRMIDLLDLKSGDHVLEIGCGWGGFFSRAIERTGCKVTAVMNSPKQAEHNRKMIAQKKLTSHVDLKEQDYRDIRGRYDKIVSIEMIEAVGEKYWPEYFKKVSESMRARGVAVIQAITIKENLFYSYRQKTDFIQNYVFPGGMLLANSVFAQKTKEHDMQLINQHEFGISYADTLKAWHRNFNNRLDEVRAMGFDDKFIRLWNLYLTYCEGAFRAGRINVGQYAMTAK